MVNSWQFVFFNLQSVTTHFLRKLSHPLPNIKQSNLYPLTSKTNFTHYGYKLSNSKKFFFKSVPLFPLSRKFHLQSVTIKAEHTEHGEHTDYVITLILNLSPLTSHLSIVAARCCRGRFRRLRFRRRLLWWTVRRNRWWHRLEPHGRSRFPRCSCRRTYR